MTTLSTLFPEFAIELQQLMRKIDRADLAAQVPALSVVARCTCGDDDCAHFYTAVPPQGRYPDPHSNVELPATAGMLILDLVDERIVAVEVLYRPDVKRPLDARFPI